jgi:hypothetical protein
MDEQNDKRIYNIDEIDNNVHNLFIQRLIDYVLICKEIEKVNLNKEKENGN